MRAASLSLRRTSALEPHALEGVDGVADLGHFQMQGAFAGLDLLVVVAVAIAPEQTVPAAVGNGPGPGTRSLRVRRLSGA